MKIISNQTLPNGISLAILEIIDPLVRYAFEDRFQIMVEIAGNKFLPKDKKKFLDFKKNKYLYILKSKKYDIDIEVTAELFYMKKLCDRSWDECTSIVMEYIGMYNNGNNLAQEIRREFVMLTD